MLFNFKEPKTLQECLERLKSGYKRMVDEDLCHSDCSIFYPGVTEEQLKKIENDYNITLCEEYKEFMKFSNGAKIMEGSANIYDIAMFGVSDPMVPDGYSTIGEIIGDGERIAISKEDGDIYSCYDGKVKYWSISNYMDQLLKDCEQEIYEHEKELIQASKDPETLKREKEECTSYWRKLIEKKKKERSDEND